MSKRKRKNKNGGQGRAKQMRMPISYSFVEPSDDLIRRVDEINERILNLKKAGRPNQFFSDGEDAFLRRLFTEERRLYEGLLFLGSVAVFELKDAFYGDELPDIPVWHGRLLVESNPANVIGSNVANGMFSPRQAVIKLNAGSHMHYEDPANEMLVTVAHELVHYWCHHQGIVDLERRCSEPTGKVLYFHNAEFKKAAEEHGLRCRLGTQGFDWTALTEEALARIREECILTNSTLESIRQYQ